MGIESSSWQTLGLAIRVTLLNVLNNCYEIHNKCNYQLTYNCASICVDKLIMLLSLPSSHRLFYKCSVTCLGIYYDVPLSFHTSTLFNYTRPANKRTHALHIEVLGSKNTGKASDYLRQSVITHPGRPKSGTFQELCQHTKPLHEWPQ